MGENLIVGLKDLLFPPKCVFCRKLLKDGEQHVCNSCVKNAPVNDKGLIDNSGEFFSGCTAPYVYDGVVREAIHRYKFQNLPGYSEFFGNRIGEAIKRDLDNKYDLISWVPLSRWSKKKRGYDQAMLLAMSAALYLDDVAVETLEKIKDTAAQSGVSGAAERRANVMGAYCVTDRELIMNKRILLIDDIITTGATLAECSRTLLMAGADEVWCAAIAIAGK